MKLPVLIATACLALGSTAWPSVLKAETTKWLDVKQSLEELLNNGWEPVNTTFTFSNTQYYNEFLLKKSGKFVTCHVSSTSVSGRHESNCYALN